MSATSWFEKNARFGVLKKNLAILPVYPSISMSSWKALTGSSTLVESSDWSMEVSADELGVADLLTSESLDFDWLSRFLFASVLTTVGFLADDVSAAGLGVDSIEFDDSESDFFDWVDSESDFFLNNDS